MRELRTRVVPRVCAKTITSATNLFDRLCRKCCTIENFHTTAAGAERAECPSQRGLLLFVSSIIRQRNHRGLVLVTLAFLDGIYWRQRTGAGRRRFLAWTGGEKRCFPLEINQHIFRLKVGRDGKTKELSIEIKSSKASRS